MSSSDRKKISPQLFGAAIAALAVLNFLAPCSAMEKAILNPESGQPMIITPQGTQKTLYDASFALVISESNYSNEDYWKKLPHTKPELDAVSSALQKNGFEVTRISDTNGAQLDQQIKEFFNTKGRIKNSRIVFIYSGHGYYDEESDSAYLAPIDSTSVNSPDSTFFTTAYAMEDLKSLALRMPAKQGIFIFDNCFSGMIFKSSSSPSRPDVIKSSSAERWRYLDRSANTEVRQFISAAGPKDTVPAKSIFMPILTQGLLGAASFRNDGYVTGKELGIFISEEVTKVSRTQVPNSDLYLKISGDMIFQTSLLPQTTYTSSPAKSLNSQTTNQSESSNSQSQLEPKKSSASDSITSKLLSSTASISTKILGPSESPKSDAGCIASEYSDIKPHPKMRAAITGRIFICYKRKGIEATFEELQATNTSEEPETIGGSFIRIDIFKDGEYTKEKIYPVKYAETHLPKPLDLPPKSTVKIPGRKVYFEMSESNYEKLKKPKGGVVSISIIDGQFKGYWMSLTVRALEKPWTSDIYKSQTTQNSSQ